MATRAKSVTVKTPGKNFGKVIKVKPAPVTFQGPKPRKNRIV